MKNLKRVVCLVLALALVCSLGLSALAASEDPYTSVTADTRGEEFLDVSTANHQEAIYALKALGVFAGFPDGHFYPDNKMTRAEFAKIVFYFCGNNAGDLTYFESLNSQFKDIYEGFWAEGYINFCAIRGHFIGYSDATFRAGNTVTMQEAATVLLRTLGYTDDLTGVWPNDYNRKAVDIGLTDYVDYIGGAPATRDQLAQMSYNILDCYKVTYIADKTAANFGYLLGAGSMLGPLVNEVQRSPYYGFINMFGVDDEGYAYLYGRTNEGIDIYWDLLGDAFGAIKKSVHFADFNFYDYQSEQRTVQAKLPGRDMIESCGWTVNNKTTGALGLDYYNCYNAVTLVGTYNQSSDLASTYYLVGGDLTDFGDTGGRVILNARGEAIFAVTDGRRAFYSNSTLPAPDYYDAYANTPFGIFKSAAADRLGYTTFSYVYSGTAGVEKLVGKTADLEPAYRFYNMTTGKFISYTELVPGDLLYDAGKIGQAELILVYNASVGNLTEVTNVIGANPGYARIAGTNYTYDAPDTEGALLSSDGGANYDFMTYSAMRDVRIMTTMEVSYAPAYKSTQLCYVAANIYPAYTYPVGVITDYTYGTDYVLDIGFGGTGRYVAVRTYTGVTLFTEDGDTETYMFAKAFDQLFFPIMQASPGTVGDLVTLQLDKDGNINNVATPSDFTLDEPHAFVDFWPYTFGNSITTDAATRRITINSNNASYHDIYTLADDAIIFVLSTDGFDFTSVKIVSAEDFLKIASYQLNQIAIYKKAGDNNTILGLYVVNCVASDQTYNGVAVSASILLGKYVLTMLDGTQYEVADFGQGDYDLFAAAVPSFVTFKVNYEGKIFGVQWIIHKAGPGSGNTEVSFPAWLAAYSGTNYAFGTGTLDSIYTNSVVTTAGNGLPSQTLFLGSNIQYYNFKANTPCSIIDISSVAEADLHGTEPTQVAYVYNTRTQEIAYMFIMNPYTQDTPS